MSANPYLTGKVWLWFYKVMKDIAMLQRILPHSPPSVALRYIGITEEETHSVLNSFSVFNNS
jgi:hypothetical protein